MRALEFHCKCGAIVCPPTKAALRLIEASGMCHKCRLAKTVEHLISVGSIELLSDILRFMEGYEGFRFDLGGL